MTNKVVIVTAVIVIAALIAGVAWKFLGGSGETPINTVTFMCDDAKSIDATFYTSKVDLKLSDGRSISLQHLVSGSGARYGNSDESFIFWNKGDTAFITEGGSQNETFSNCITGGAAGPVTTGNSYSSTTLGVQLSYPAGYTKDESYAYSQFGEAKLIHGVKFTIPAAMATGTNLAPDSGVSLEVLPRAKMCTGDIYILANVKAANVTDNGLTYSVASSSDAGAGNRYEEVVYALPSSKPCIALRYFVHYNVIENYPAGSVREFDRAALMASFDSIRTSLKFNLNAAPAQGGSASSSSAM